MTTTTTSATTLPDRIRDEPHWCVRIHPGSDQKERIATFDECWRIIERTQVPSLMYPVIGVDGERGHGSHWIDSSRESENGNMDYWRFYQSGRFIHLFTFLEDRSDMRELIENREFGWPLPADLTGYFLFDEAIHRFTAIFELAARLMDAGALDHAPVVRISMRQVKGRLLTFYKFPFAGAPHYKATTEEPLEQEWQITSLDDPMKRAREAASWFFEGFGYGVLEGVLKREQDDFLAGRWYF